MPDEGFRKWLGVDYEVMEDYLVVLTVEDGHLVIRASDDPEPTLGLAQSETNFFFPDINLMLDVERDEERSVTGLRMLQGAHRMSASPIEGPAEPGS